MWLLTLQAHGEAAGAEAAAGENEQAKGHRDMGGCVGKAAHGHRRRGSEHACQAFSGRRESSATEQAPGDAGGSAPAPYAVVGRQPASAAGWSRVHLAACSGLALLCANAKRRYQKCQTHWPRHMQLQCSNAQQRLHRRRAPSTLGPSQISSQTSAVRFYVPKQLRNRHPIRCRCCCVAASALPASTRQIFCRQRRGAAGGGAADTNVEPSC